MQKKGRARDKETKMPGETDAQSLGFVLRQAFY